MIVVCDTNVLISGLLFPGAAPDKIIRSILTNRLNNAISPDIVTELKRIVLTKMKINAEKTENLLQLIIRQSQMVYPSERLHVVKDDEEDNRILECAVTAKASFIVTGDKKHLLPLKKFQKIEIITPKTLADTLVLF